MKIIIARLQKKKKNSSISIEIALKISIFRVDLVNYLIIKKRCKNYIIILPIILLDYIIFKYLY